MPAILGELDTCRVCGTEVIWLLHERTEKLAPIEVHPADIGTFVVDFNAHTYSTYFGLKKRSMDYYVNHYSACPRAAFSRDRRRN